MSKCSDVLHPSYTSLFSAMAEDTQRSGAGVGDIAGGVEALSDFHAPGLQGSRFMS